MGRQPIPKESVNSAIRRYIQGGCTLSEAAKLFGFSGRTLRTYLKDNMGLVTTMKKEISDLRKAVNEAKKNEQIGKMKKYLGIDKIEIK